MTPRRWLGRLDSAARGRLRRLCDLALHASAVADPVAAKLELGALTIDTLSVWANFCRAYYLSLCHHCRSKSGSSVTVASGPLADDDALRQAVSVVRPHWPPAPGARVHRRDEPAWHDKHVLLAACRAVSCSNIGQVEIALGIATTVFDDLVVFRNYFAHKGQSTSAAASQLMPRYGIPITMRPAEALKRWPLRRSHPLLVEWISDLEVLVEVLCE